MDDNGTLTAKYAVFVTAAMLVFVSILRLVWRLYLGTDDSTLLDLQITLITLFTGSVGIHAVLASTQKRRNNSDKDTHNGSNRE